VNAQATTALDHRLPRLHVPVLFGFDASPCPCFHASLPAGSLACPDLPVSGKRCRIGVISQLNCPFSNASNRNTVPLTADCQLAENKGKQLFLIAKKFTVTKSQYVEFTADIFL
jgi:hypothetical protein